MLSLQIFKPRSKEEAIKHHPSCVCSLCLSVPKYKGFKVGDKVKVKSSGKEGIIEWLGGDTASVEMSLNKADNRSHIRYFNLEEISST